MAHKLVKHLVDSQAVILAHVIQQAKGMILKQQRKKKRTQYNEMTFSIKQTRDAQ